MKTDKLVLPLSIATALIVTSLTPCRREPPHPEQYQNLPYAETLTDAIVSTNTASGTISFSVPAARQFE